MLFVVGTLGMTFALCGVSSFVLIYWRRQPPADVRRLVEPRLPALRDFTGRIASRCQEVRHRRGIDSPGHDTELARWPELVQLRTVCMWWTSSGGAEGNDFAPLATTPSPERRAAQGSWEISRDFLDREGDESRSEEALWPSLEVEDPRAIDVRVRRPLAGGDGYIEVTATLRAVDR